jgi:lipoprotein-anchoring transpeptidase ErfK/SrfK
VRRMALIAGAIAALAIAAFTLNTANAAPRGAQGSVISLVAATRTIAAADRDEAALAARTTTEAMTTSEPTEKPDVEARTAAPRVTVSAGCQQAINNLKALHQADVAEDASERTAQPQTAAAALADRTEDAVEAQRWVKALMAARAACLPQPTATCQAEIASLQSELQTTRAEELAELSASTQDQSDWLADWMSIRTAFSAVATACATRE